MTEHTLLKKESGAESASDPDSRLGAFRTEQPVTPADGQEPRSQAPQTHVEDRDVDPVPASKDNTGISPS